MFALLQRTLFFSIRTARRSVHISTPPNVVVRRFIISQEITHLFKEFSMNPQKEFNVPFGIVATLLAILMLHEFPHESTGKLDIWGFSFSTRAQELYVYDECGHYVDHSNRIICRLVSAPVVFSEHHGLHGLTHRFIYDPSRPRVCRHDAD